MKISVQTRKLKDIGDLDGSLRLPMSGRIRAGLTTICDRCRKPITDEYFMGGFKAGIKNMKFHESCLANSEGKKE